jgi:hypothetical protein
MLIKELIEILKKYPPDIPVRVGWEATLHDIIRDDIDIVETKEYIVIDADGNRWF